MTFFTDIPGKQPDTRCLLEFTSVLNDSKSWYAGYVPGGGKPVITAKREIAYIFPDAEHAANVLQMDIRHQGGKVVPYAER